MPNLDFAQFVEASCILSFSSWLFTFAVVLSAGLWFFRIHKKKVETAVPYSVQVPQQCFTSWNGDGLDSANQEVRRNGRYCLMNFTL